MTRTKITLAALALLAIGCGDAKPGIPNDGLGELVACDEVKVMGQGNYTITYLEAVYPGVVEGTAIFTFCDFWSVNNGNYTESATDCTEGRNPDPGYYQDGDLHVVCSVLQPNLETGANRIYVRFDTDTGGTVTP